jgi:hypothetical protein
VAESFHAFFIPLRLVVCAVFARRAVAFPAMVAPCDARRSRRINHMIDLVYVLGTVAFFGLMLLYIAGCDRLGRGADVERTNEETR